jgi:hypothetical protein
MWGSIAIAIAAIILIIATLAAAGWIGQQL